MATKGFWPVKGKLKDVIEYAQNPDKTTDPKYLDDDLYMALRYVGNDEKTDKAMYVDSINCPKKRAYEQMMTTKRRFGKMGGNVAYHGFQSFRTGEVTPEEAHDIGMEEILEKLVSRVIPQNKNHYVWKLNLDTNDEEDYIVNVVGRKNHYSVYLPGDPSLDGDDSSPLHTNILYLSDFLELMKGNKKYSPRRIPHRLLSTARNNQ